MPDIKLGIYSLSNNTVEKMKHKLDKSRKTKIEIGFPLCADGNNIIHAGDQCEGTECSIKQKELRKESGCNKKGRYVGSYHTHPEATVQLSEGDIFNACKDEIICVAGDIGGISKCYTRKTKPETWDECMIKGFSLADERLKLNERSGEYTSKEIAEKENYLEKKRREILEEHFNEGMFGKEIFSGYGIKGHVSKEEMYRQFQEKDRLMREKARKGRK